MRGIFPGLTTDQRLDLVPEVEYNMYPPVKGSTNPNYGADPQWDKIENIHKKYGFAQPYEDPLSPKVNRNWRRDEYDHLQNFRWLHNLDPTKEVTPEDIRRWKRNGDFNGNGWWAYPDDMLLEYFNGVASNPNPLFNPNNIKNAYGLNNGQIIYAANGKSPIHIKPANRGKLTRLKKRTGKSESELYNDGNPAHRKMVVFARNARKWKH